MSWKCQGWTTMTTQCNLSVVTNYLHNEPLLIIIIGKVKRLAENNLQCHDINLIISLIPSIVKRNVWQTLKERNVTLLTNSWWRQFSLDGNGSVALCNFFISCATLFTLSIHKSIWKSHEQRLKRSKLIVINS